MFAFVYPKLRVCVSFTYAPGHEGVWEREAKTRLIDFGISVSKDGGNTVSVLN
jgi:hypothetical protein